MRRHSFMSNRVRLKRPVKEGIHPESGLAGTLLQFELGYGARKTGYWVGVFVDPRRIVTVEIGGPVDELKEQADALHTSIRSVR